MKAAAQVREPAEVALVNRIKQLRRDTVLVCTEEDGFILRVTIEDLVRHYVLHLPDAQKQKLLTQLGKCEMAEILMSSPMYCGKSTRNPTNAHAVHVTATVVPKPAANAKNAQNPAIGLKCPMTKTQARRRKLTKRRGCATTGGNKDISRLSAPTA